MLIIENIFFIWNTFKTILGVQAGNSSILNYI